MLTPRAETILRDPRSWLALVGLSAGLLYLALPWAYSVSALVVFLLLMVAVVRYQYLAFLAVCLMPLEKIHLLISLQNKLDTYYVMKFYPYQIPLLAAVLGLLIKKTVDRTPLVFTPLDPWLWIITAYLLLSVLWSPDSTLALLMTANVIIHLLIYHVVVNAVSDEKSLRQYLIAVMIGGILCAIGILVSKDIDESMVVNLTPNIHLALGFGTQASRPAGIGGADHVGGFVAFALFAYLGYILMQKGWLRRTLLLILMTTCFSAVLYTVSRGGLIAISVAFVLSLALQAPLRPRLFRLMGIYFVASLLLIVLVSPGIIDRMLVGFGYTGQLLVSEKTFTSNQASTAAGGNLTGMGARLNWWKTTLKAMNKDPWMYLTGIGLTGFSFYSVYQGNISPETNSIYFSFFFEGGLVGLLIVCPMLYIILASATNAYLRTQGTDRILLVTVFAMVTADLVVRGLIDYDLISYGAKFCWSQMALVMAVLNIMHQGDPKAGLRPRWPVRGWASRVRPAGDTVVLTNQAPGSY